MANALSTETPPAPTPGSTNALMSGSPSARPAAPAPPTHAQTVAALRHFDAIRRELEIVLKDPSLGKSNMKSKIIDGMTRLVGERYLKPAEAVNELSKVPAEPLQQMKWAKMMYGQAQQAENAILAHHAIGFAGGGPEAAPSMDNHMDDIASVMANFGKANG